MYILTFAISQLSGAAGSRRSATPKVDRFSPNSMSIDLRSSNVGLGTAGRWGGATRTSRRFRSRARECAWRQLDNSQVS